MHFDMDWSPATGLALVVGIDRYEVVPNLRSAVADADAIASALETTHGFEVVRLTSADDTTKAAIAAAISDLDERLSNCGLAPIQRRLLVYFAGHGVALDTGDNGPQGFLLPCDTRPDELATMLPMQWVHDQLAALDCGHLLLVLDCCFAGSFRWSTTRNIARASERLFPLRLSRYVEQPARQVFTSAAYDQRALDSDGSFALGQRDDDSKCHAHSPFAAALLEALGGAADVSGRDQKPDGLITTTELLLYVRDKVELSGAVRGRQTPELWPMGGHGRGEFLFRTPNRTLALGDDPVLDAATVPWRGLQSYEREHRPTFFGRARLIEDLRDRVREGEHRLITVLGPSGCGKSSVVNAGLLPSLADDEEWTIAGPIRPGVDPLAVIEETTRSWSDGRKRLLVIDQFEELFTQCIDRSQRNTALQRIEAMITSDRHTVVLITMQTEFLPHLSKDSPESGAVSLEDRARRGRFIVGDMTVDELRTIIVGPADAVALVFDPPEIVDELVQEVVGMPGALPLLNFFLREVYLARLARDPADRALTRADIETAGGGVGRALQARADRLIANMDVLAQAAFEQMMLRMVSTEGGTLSRRRMSLAQLRFTALQQTKRAHEVCRLLVDARLLIRLTANASDGANDELSTYVEPAHDTLIVGWGRMLGWLDEHHDWLPIAAKLWRDTLDWDQNGRPAAKLWADKPELAIAWARLAQQPDSLNALETTFIDASEKLETARRRSAWTVTTLVGTVLLGLTIALVVFANRAGKNADEVEANARQARQQAAAAAAYALAETDPTVALDLARRAGMTTNETASLAAVKAFNTGSWFYSHRFDGVWTGDISGDGKRLAWIDEDDVLHMLELDSGEESTRAGVDASDLRFLANGNLVTWSFGSDDEYVELRGPAGDALHRHELRMVRAYVCGDTVYVPSASTDPRAMTIDIIDGTTGARSTQTLVRDHIDLGMPGACLVKDEGFVIAGGMMIGSLFVIRPGRPVIEIDDFDPSALALGPGNRAYGLVSSRPYDVLAWVDIDEPSPNIRKLTLEGFDSGDGSLLVLAEGRVLVTSLDGRARIVSVETGEITDLASKTRAVDASALSTEAGLFALARRSGIATIYDLNGVTLGQLLGEAPSDGLNAKFLHLRFDDAGTKLVSVTRDGLRLWQRPRYTLTLVHGPGFGPADDPPESSLALLRSLAGSSENVVVNCEENIGIDNGGAMTACIELGGRQDRVHSGLASDELGLFASGEVEGLGHRWMGNRSDRLFVFSPGLIEKLVEQEIEQGRMWRPDAKLVEAWLQVGGTNNLED